MTDTRDRDDVVPRPQKRRAPKVADVAALIGAAGTDPTLWADVPAAIGGLLPGAKVALQIGTRRHVAEIELLASGFEPALVAEYADYYGYINPWRLFWAKATPMRVYVADETMPAASLRHTEFYNDWLRRVGDADGAVGVKLVEDGERSALLAIHYSERQADGYNTAGRHLLEELRSPLRNAIDLNREAEVEAAVSVVEQMMAAFGDPAVMVDEKNLVMTANRAGEALLAGASPVERDRTGRLRFADPAAQLAAETFAASLARSVGGLRSTWPVRDREGDLIAVVTAVDVALPTTAGRTMASLLPPKRVGLLTIRTRALPETADAELRRLMALTSAEWRLAARLARGDTLQEIAEEFGLSTETLRQQLKSVFRKTNTRRQSELVLLLARFGGL